MRVKIQGKIIQENKSLLKRNYNHEMYSMILTNISTERAKRIHTKERFKRLFTFTNMYCKKDMIYFYVSGEDSLIKDFVNFIMFNQLIRIGDKVINVNNIEPINNKLQEKDEYTFKTNFIVNDMKNNKVHLSEDLEYVKRRIKEIAISKYNEINETKIENADLQVDLVSIKHVYIPYKKHHINSYKSIIKLKGDLRLIDTIYNVGIGENTATGHGFVWEV